MGAAVESLPARAQGLRASSMKRPLGLQMGGSRIVVDPDGSVRVFRSLREKRALFGYEQVWLYKVQAGIVVQAPKPDWAFRLSPRSAHFTGRVFDSVEVVQSVEFYSGASMGYLRRLKLRNGGQGTIKLRALELSDPTAAHYGETSGTWGSLGMNAFNRESHVAMDEVSDPPSARVIGAAPSPSKFYMTTNSSRAQELVAAGDLPDATAGMSGQVLVLSSHEMELAPGEGKELAFGLLYNAGKLEDALSDFGRLQSGERQPELRRPVVATSEMNVTEAAAWAASALEGAAFADDPLDRYEALRAVTYLDPASARSIIAESKLALRKDGSLPHSLQQARAGTLETAVFLQAAAAHLSMAQDKKMARASYPFVKKLAGYLLASSKEFTVQTDPALPQGWRRNLGSGYPTGEIPEVALAVAGALAGASQVAREASKSVDAGKLRERAEMIADHVNKKLLDERGYLALCRDTSGRLRNDETVDMAVAAYRRAPKPSAHQAAAHRLLEKDFDTPYGPRCVPTTNQLYFNRAYGRGQLGAVWTRAVLAHALVCYRAGLPGMGSLTLGKVSRLVIDDAQRLGGTPGEFPQWVDVDAREVHGEEPDLVAAARFIEALLEGELGLPAGSEREPLSPPASSGLGWLMASDIWVGEPSSFFLGRWAGKPHLFFSGSRVDSKVGAKFGKSERIELPVRGVYGVTFHSPGQIVCLGNSTASQARFAVSFSPRAADLSRRLSTPLETYEPSTGSWTKSGSLRVSPTMAFDASLEPNGWKVVRVSTV